MTFNSVRALVGLSANVVPADVRANGSYDIGGPTESGSFPDANQIYSIKVTGQAGDASLVVDTGVLTLSGAGTLLGGDGLDPDGQTVNFGLLYALLVKNTGAVSLTLVTSTWGGTDGSPVSEIEIPAGGVYYQSIPDGNDTTGTPVLLLGNGGDSALAYEIVALGKIPA